MSCLGDIPSRAKLPPEMLSKGKSRCLLTESVAQCTSTAEEPSFLTVSTATVMLSLVDAPSGMTIDSGDAWDG